MSSPALFAAGALRAPPAGGGGLSLATIVSNAGLNSTAQWTDNCSNADPLADLRWCLTDCERTDGAVGGACDGSNFSTEYDNGGDMGDILTGRFVQSGSGGATGGGNYQFYAAKSNKAVFACPPVGRAAIGYPKFDPGSTPTHDGPTGAGFSYQGRRHVFAFATKLDAAWDLDKTEAEGFAIWRVLAQWKQNEWISVSQDSPQLSFQQRLNEYIVTANDDTDTDVTVWNHTAIGTVNTWIRWAFDITFHQSTGTGRIRIYADFNNDGDYEYDSGNITGIETLCPGSQVTDGSPPRSYASEGVEAMFSPGIYEGEGDDKAKFSDFAIYGIPGG